MRERERGHGMSQLLWLNMKDKLDRSVKCVLRRAWKSICWSPPTVDFDLVFTDTHTPTARQHNGALPLPKTRPWSWQHWEVSDEFPPVSARLWLKPRITPGGSVAASSISTCLVVDPPIPVGFKVGPPLIELVLVQIGAWGVERVELFPPYSHDFVAGLGAVSCTTLHTVWVFCFFCFFGRKYVPYACMQAFHRNSAFCTNVPT